MITCWSAYCRHDNVSSSCRFFKFPDSEEEKRLWQQLLRRSSKPQPDSYVCSCHFRDGTIANGPEIIRSSKNTNFSWTRRIRKGRKDRVKKRAPDLKPNKPTTSSSIPGSQSSPEQNCPETDSRCQATDNFFKGNKVHIKASASLVCTNEKFADAFKENIRKHFGYHSHHPLQLYITEALLCQQRDVCAILAPGFGKSLCYQYAAITGNVVLVVGSMTNSVLEQIQFLNICGITTCMLGVTADDFDLKITDISLQKFKIIYATPEFIGKYGKSLDKQLGLIAVNEAHCVSPSSHDFRTQYSTLVSLRDYFPKVPWLAISSTLLPLVRTDIVNCFQMRQPLYVYSGFHRPNIYLQVKAKINVKQLLDDVLSLIRDSPGIALIYVFSRNDVDVMVRFLTVNSDAEVVGVHGGIPVCERKQIYTNILRDKYKIIVTTSAYAMNVTRPDIRNIIHCHVPKDIESYYQEIGRASIDGMPAICTLFYSETDMEAQKVLRIASICSPVIRERRNFIAELLTEYMLTSECRWYFLMKHIQGKLIKRRSSGTCCDNCSNEESKSDEKIIISVSGKYQLTQDMYSFLKIMYNFYVKGRYCLLSDAYNRLSCKSRKWWEGITYLAEKYDYIKCSPPVSDNEPITKCSITEKGILFIKNTVYQKKPQIWMKITDEMRDELIKAKSRPVKTPNELRKLMQNNSFVDKQIFNNLVTVRLNIADKISCSPYAIISDKALNQMSILKPCSVDALKNFYWYGLSEEAVRKFGSLFIEAIKMCDENDEDADAQSP